MGQIAIQTRVEGPVAEVFRLFTDIETSAAHIDGITKVEMLTAGPIGSGTRWRESRVMFKRDATCELEIADFVRDQQYSVVAEECGVKYITTFRFTADASGTVVDCEMKSQATTLTARIFGIVLFPMTMMMNGMMKKCLAADMQDLKRAFEANEVATR